MIKTELESGSPYSLLSLFSGDNRKIIIPDLQRDYCWAEIKNKEDMSLVRAFIDSLVDYYDNRKEGEEMNLGLIYAYEKPDDFVHLCDGQQRLTTLYLLIGLLYRRTKIDLLKNCLMSDHEIIKDDHEGYLQYAIRDTSLFFLNDLVFHYFLEHEETELKKWNETYYSFESPWYFDRYKKDKTINNICTAIHQIEMKLDEYFTQSKNRSLESFADFVLTQIKLLYYDVTSRKQGEEMFVVINTTGLELTTTENLKPSLLGDLHEELTKNNELTNAIVENIITTYNHAWEKREDFFWENKDIVKKEQISDNGLSDFFSWLLKIELKSDGIGGRLLPTVKEFKKWKETKLSSEKLLLGVNAYFISLQRVIGILNLECNLIVYNSLIAKGRVYQFSEITFSSLRNLTYDTTKPESITEQQFFMLPLLAFVTKFQDATADNIATLIRFLRYNYYTKKRQTKGVDSKVLIETITYCNSESAQPCFDLFFTAEFKLVEGFRTLDSKIIDDWCNDWDFMGNLSPLFETGISQTEIIEVTHELLDELRVYMTLYKQLQNIAYNNSKNDIDHNLIKLSNLLTFDYYYNVGSRYGNIQGQSYYSIDFFIINNSHILVNQKYFSSTWKKLRENGEVNAIEELINKLSSELETMWTGRFWLLLSCAEASKQMKSLGNYFCNQNLGLSYYNNNPYDPDNGGKLYSLKELNSDWGLYNSVGNSFVGHTYSSRKWDFDYRQNTLIEKVSKQEEFSDIQSQIIEREDYFYTVIEEIYGINLKQKFYFSDKQRKNEKRYQLFVKIKEQIDTIAQMHFFELKSVGTNLWNDCETKGYSELDWYTVGVPINNRYIIAITSNREIIQYGLRKHPVSKPEEQQEIIEKLKNIESEQFENVGLQQNGWWYLYTDARFDEKCDEVDFFVQYILALYSELKINISNQLS